MIGYFDTALFNQIHLAWITDTSTVAQAKTWPESHLETNRWPIQYTGMRSSNHVGVRDTKRIFRCN
jgi:hypothetical protein